MGSGWIRLHRQIKDNPIVWCDEPYSHAQAWIDLILRANYEDKKILFDGKVVEVKRGSFITSVRRLATDWKWSPDKTLQYLRVLETEKMIKKISDKRRTLLIIVNYDFYQDTANTGRTLGEHSANTEPAQRKKEKKERNKVSNNPPYPPTGEWDYNGHSNLENVKHFLNCCEYEGKEYIRGNKELWELIKAWMEYKDAKRPKASNHYVNERSLKSLLNQFVKNSEKYGVSNVAAVVDETMSKTYSGITWDKLEKGKFGQNGIEAFLKSMEDGNGN